MQPSHAPIPTMQNSFVGRKRELAQLYPLLVSHRLVTLTGPAGCGKTRLAQRLASEVQTQYVGGIYWVELAPLEDALLLPQALASALDIPEQPDSPPLRELMDILRTKQALLILDNCEHLLSACAELVYALLTATPVTVLATSREALGVMGERRFPIMPLPLPAADLSLADLQENEAVRLFVERAQAVLPQFELTDDNGDAVADICRRLDGIPLAIELASARLNVLTAQQLAARLDDRFAVLASATHVTQNYHGTLEAAIDWSYTLLSHQERLLLRRIAVFTGGFSLEAAETVCGDEELNRQQVLELIASLVNKSLLVADTLHRSQARYRLLEMVRAYAQDRLNDCGERLTMEARHLRWVVDCTEAIAPKLRAGEQQIWLDWIDQEQDNIRAALAWALESSALEAGLRITIGMYQFWVTRGAWLEGKTWFERFFRDLSDDIPLPLRVTALTYGAWLAMFSFDAANATRWSQIAVRLCEEAGEEGEALMGLALAGASGAARTAGDVRTSFQLSQRAYQLGRGKTGPLMEGMQLMVMGYTSILLGEYEPAGPYLEQALQLAHLSQDRWRVGITLATMADLARHEQRFADAIALYADSLAEFESLRSLGELPNVERGSAYAWLRLGQLQQARTLFERSLMQQRALKSRLGLLQGLLGFGALSAALDRLPAAARLHGFVLGDREWLNVLPDSGNSADRIDYYHYFVQVRARLPRADIDAEQQQARALSTEQAIAFALDATALPARSPASNGSVSPALSRREYEVTKLIARGLSNGQIAETLVLSKRTVEHHVASIFAKLGFSNRAQVVRWGVESGLIDIEER